MCELLVSYWKDGNCHCMWIVVSTGWDYDRLGRVLTSAGVAPVSSSTGSAHQSITVKCSLPYRAAYVQGDLTGALPLNLLTFFFYFLPLSPLTVSFLSDTGIVSGHSVLRWRGTHILKFRP